MPRPTAGYKNASGERIPSVTTILGRYKSAGGLIHWANQLGLQGKDYREARDAAADAGQLAHRMVEAYLHEQEPSLDGAEPETIEKARQAFHSWTVWKEMSRLDIQAWEEPLVCEHYQYGGTPDAVAWDADDQLAVVDWKTGNIYGDQHLPQLVAYRHLFEDHFPDVRLAGYHIGSFSREHGDFKHLYFDNLSEAWEYFLLLRKAYDLDKALNKRVK